MSGYDRTRTALTDALVAEGAAVHFEDAVAAVDPDAEWVVYTPAIPASSAVLGFYRAGGYLMMKRSDVLQRITAGTFNICIAGTHGKTTITTLTAHILRHSGYGCTAFLGGISGNYDTNFWSSDNGVCVVEADEYDRSFLKLDPAMAVVTAMDPDHLDIYGTAAAMEEAFIAFAGRVKPGGWLLSKHGLPRGGELSASQHLTYSLADAAASVHADGLRAEDGAYVFDIVVPGGRLEGIILHMGGRHNVENTLAAAAVAHQLGIKSHAIRDAVAAFKGVHRRFEFVLRNPSVVLVDDYAHHPEELRALLAGAKDLFPERTCTVIFQPHLYSRTRDLAPEFASALDLADEVLLLPIYPARELPMEGVSSEMILERMKNPHRRLITKEDLLEWAAALPVVGVAPRLIIMAGAGDIDALVEPVAEKLGERA